MGQSGRIDNYQKLLDESVELVLFVDIEKDTYEVVHTADRLVWDMQIQGTYSSFVKYIEKHIEEDENKQDLQNKYSLRSFQRMKITDEALEKEYVITMQGRYETISLMSYLMEEILEYQHTGILVVRLLTEKKEAIQKQSELYQVARSLCQMAVMVHLYEDQIHYLVMPEFALDKVMNLPNTYEGFLSELLQVIHVQDQDIVKHMLTQAYLETKLKEGAFFAFQVRCKGRDEAFHDIDIICTRTEGKSERESLDFVLMLKNITAEKKMIDELQQRIQQLENRLEQAREEKEELCSMIARELHRKL